MQSHLHNGGGTLNRVAQNWKPFYTLPWYQAGPKTGVFEKREFDGMYIMDIVKPVQSDQELPKMFVPEKANCPILPVLSKIKLSDTVRLLPNAAQWGIN